MHCGYFVHKSHRILRCQFRSFLKLLTCFFALAVFEQLLPSDSLRSQRSKALCRLTLTLDRINQRVHLLKYIIRYLVTSLPAIRFHQV